MDSNIRHVFWLARTYNQPLHTGVTSVLDWPWTWVRLAFLVRVVEGVHERAAVLDVPVPPDEIIFNPAEVDRWFENAKEKNLGDKNIEG